MALETPENVKEIGEHPVHHGDLGHNCDTYGERQDLLHDIISHLDVAIEQLEARIKDRDARGVEGTRKE